MDRRDFLAATGASLGTAALAMMGCNGASTSPAADWLGNLGEPLAVARRPKRRGIRMVLGCQWPHLGKDALALRARFGVNHLCAYPPTRDDGTWAVEDLVKFREHVESYGLHLDMLPLPMRSVGVDKKGNLPNIMRGIDPDRDRDIDNICDMIRATAKAGIPSLRYNLALLSTPHTPSVAGRGGSRYLAWQRHKARDLDTLTPLGRVDADTVWERITHFLERVIPVAAEYKVRMACHPHDPGITHYRGIDRVLGSPDGLKRLVSIQESPYHGVNFCVGTVAAMLARPGEELPAIIRWFGRRRKIFNVHLRNIRGRHDDFFEVYPDEGDLDLFRIVQLLDELGYPYMVMPDHVPWHPDDTDWTDGFSFAYGYISALLQAVDTLAAARA